MTALFKAEFRRFARWALGLGALHAAALFILDRTFPAMRDDSEIAIVIAFAYGFVGAIFGFYQSANYARINHWVALLHRPLAPWRIMAAVKGASATLLFLAVTLPLLLFTAALALQDGRVVDARHWPLAIAGGLIALIGFGTGSYLALAPRRYGWTAVLAVFGLLVTNQGAGPAALILPLIIISVLAILMAGAFKPERSSPPAEPVLLAATAGVAGLSLYFLFVGLSGLVYQLGAGAVGRNPETSPPAGGVVEATRANSNEVIAAALAAAPSSKAAAVMADLEGIEAVRLPIAFGALPTRGELTNSGPIGFKDPRRSIDWTYSHDSQAFEGVRVKDGRRVGELKPAGGFGATPLLVSNDAMIAGDSLYRYDPSSGRLERRLELSSGERIVAKPSPAGQSVAVLSDRALYFVDGKALEVGDASGSMIAVPLAGEVGDLQRLDMAQLADRRIVSFFYGRDSLDGPAKAWQQIVSVAPNGMVETLAQRRLGPDNSDALRFRSYWVSPTFREIVAAAEAIGSNAAWRPSRAPIEVPRNVWIAASLLSLLAAVITAWLAVRRRSSRPMVAAWSLSALIFGLPMLAAFCLLGRNPLSRTQ